MGVRKKMQRRLLKRHRPTQAFKALWGEREPESSGTYCGNGAIVALTVTSLSGLPRHLIPSLAESAEYSFHKLNQVSRILRMASIAVKFYLDRIRSVQTCNIYLSPSHRYI
jgi:hypothetical protein